MSKAGECFDMSPARAASLARELFAIWKHLGFVECSEQIEAHMESDGFNADEVAAAMACIDDQLYGLE